MRILIIQTAFIGDVVLATPIPVALKQLYPEAQIDVLVRKGNEGLLKNFPEINRVLIWDKKNQKVRNLFRLIREIQKSRYDEIINLQRFFATGLMTVMGGAKVSRGFRKNPLSFLFTESVDHAIGDAETHETDRNLKLIAAHGWKGKLRPVLYPSQEDFSFVKAWQQEPYVCMAPTSVWFTKQLPESQWVKLIGLLAKQQPALRIYLLGAPADEQACEIIRQAAKQAQVMNLCGKSNFLQTAALMKGARMNYVNDSAPLHIASAMNAPVTAFFCSTIPAFGFGPLSEQQQIAEVAETLACRPCGLHGKKTCPEGHYRCGFDIQINEKLLPAT